MKQGLSDITIVIGSTFSVASRAVSNLRSGRADELNYSDSDRREML